MFLTGAIMPSSFGFDKLVSINKSLTFTILSELNTEESVVWCCGIRWVFGFWIGHWIKLTCILFRITYFTVYLTIDKLSHMANYPSSILDSTPTNRLHPKFILPQQSTLQFKKFKLDVSILDFIWHRIALSLCRTQLSSSSLANDRG